jgi:hypothetical protein
MGFGYFWDVITYKDKAPKDTEPKAEHTKSNCEDPKSKPDDKPSEDTKSNPQRQGRLRPKILLPRTLPWEILLPTCLRKSLYQSCNGFFNESSSGFDNLELAPLLIRDVLCLLTLKLLLAEFYTPVSVLLSKVS